MYWAILAFLLLMQKSKSATNPETEIWKQKRSWTWGSCGAYVVELSLISKKTLKGEVVKQKLILDLESILVFDFDGFQYMQ